MFFREHEHTPMLRIIVSETSQAHIAQSAYGDNP